MRYVSQMTDDSRADTKISSPVDPTIASSFSARPNPGRTLSIVGFALSFLFPLNIAGLVLSIVALVMSRRAGQKNGLALAGVIIASIGILVAILISVIVAPFFIDAAQTCAQLGNGVHVVGNSTYSCTPVSFSVTTRP